MSVSRTRRRKLRKLRRKFGLCPPCGAPKPKLAAVCARCKQKGRVH